MEYFLPDLDLLNSNIDFDYKVWQPNDKFIVLGRSDNIDNSVIVENAQKLNLRIIKRPSGGHSVVLTPKTIVVSMVFKYNKQRPVDIFLIANRLIISCLELLGVENVNQKGISDICIGDRKIVGSSIYKKPDKYFYHAVINYAQNTDIFEQLLKHPSTEPSYRQGRSHKDFVTSLVENNFKYSIDEFINNLNLILEKYKTQIYEKNMG